MERLGATIEWMGVAIEWMNAHPNLGGWVQGIGTGLAGFAALAAGILAYRGALVQARTQRDAQERERAERQRSAAAITQAEFAALALRVLVIADSVSKNMLVDEMFRRVDAILSDVWAIIDRIGSFDARTSMLVIGALETVEAAIYGVRANRYRFGNRKFADHTVEGLINALESIIVAVEALEKYAPRDRELVKALRKMLRDLKAGKREDGSREQ